MTKLTSEMAKQIIAQLGLVLPEDSKNDLERVIALRPKQSAQAISLFTNTINVLSQTFVPILLLDSVELVSEAVRDEVETQIIEPVIWNDRVIIIVAGRRQIPRWKRFEVRRRVADAASTAIEPFDRTTVRTLLGKMGFMGLADEVYALSYGHPQTTDLLGRTFKQAAERFSVDSAYLINRQRELGDFLGQVEDYVLEGTKAETRTNLELISVLRYFRVDPLRKFMIEFRGKQFAEKSDLYYLKDIIGAMETTNLVWWSRQHRAYVISGVVRRIMNRRLGLAKPDYYIHLHQKALGMYLGWIGEFPSNASEFIIESIFHSAMLAQITDSGELGESITKRLDDAMKLSPEDANTLYEQFGTDKELEDLLSPEEHRRLLDEFANIRDHKNQTRQ
jgi:hypothetical protein